MLVSSPPIETGDLNKECLCFPIDRGHVDKTILAMSDNREMAELLAKRETYFASTAVFLSQAHYDDILEQITTLEAVIKTRSFETHIEQRAGRSVLETQAGTAGVFMGYDFHLTPDGPRLIEINSNAGGAFIVSALEAAIGKDPESAEDMIANMFTSEWIKSGRKGRPKTIAIVDESPREQFHYPDMCLAKAVLERRGFKVFITDPNSLRFDGSAVWFGDHAIDMVYNRLTDFSLAQTESAILKEAFEAGAVVITPSPRHHALYADKRNLAAFSDAALLKRWGVSEGQRKILKKIPETRLVTPENADGFWANRKLYFFKPQGGFGSRAAYRGSKITKKVWAHICQGGYVAQRFMAPPVRAVNRGGGAVELKFDLRVYSYDGRPLLLAARVYQGQTTNLRTAGGGLAPVVVLDSLDMGCRA